MQLRQLLSALAQLQSVGGAFRDAEITSVVSDSRRVTPGSLFVALRGREADGHRHVREAITRGAAAVVLETAPDADPSLPCFLVPDSREAEALLASRFRGDPASSLRIFAVTGTNGKTSTTAFLASILRAAGRRVGTLGTLGRSGDETNEMPSGGSSVSGKAAAMTTPDPEILYDTLASFRESGMTDVVLEASSHALAQRKLAPIRPAFALFTNLSPEHLDYHGTMERYLAAKATLFAAAEHAVISTVSPYGERLLSGVSCPAVRCGCTARDDYRIETCTERPDGCTFRLAAPGGTVFLQTAMPGRFMAENAALAAAAAWEAGIPRGAITAGVAACRSIPGRMEPVSDGTVRPYTVMIDYAHTPEALRELLLAARRFTRRRLIVLFGCGGDRDRSKRPLMGAVAASLADMTVLTSDNCRTEQPEAILGEILSGFPPAATREVIPSRAEAIRRAVFLLGDGDVLLLAGKGHEKYEIDASGKHPFDEAAIALSAMRERDGK